jgi:hypothetical protein
MGTAAGGGTGDRHQLTADFEAVLAGIRKLDGFGSFAEPPPVEELLAEAREGAVVVLNVSTLRSDALVLTHTGVTAVPLPELGADAVTRRTAVFQAAVHDATASPDGRRRRQAQEELSGVLGWLWDAAAEPVLRALGHHRPPPHGAAWPRVWWVPCGPLSLPPAATTSRERRCWTGPSPRTPPPSAPCGTPAARCPMPTSPGSRWSSPCPPRPAAIRWTMCRTKSPS